MAFVYHNHNPNGDRIIDCSVRAIAKVLGKEWEDAYIGLCALGHSYKEMPHSSYVIEMYMKEFGYEKKVISSISPQCTTVKRFSDENSEGKFVLVTENYTVAVIDGDYYDIWDCGDEIVLCYYKEVK